MIIALFHLENLEMAQTFLCIYTTTNSHFAPPDSYMQIKREEYALHTNWWDTTYVNNNGIEYSNEKPARF